MRQKLSFEDWMETIHGINVNDINFRWQTIHEKESFVKTYELHQSAKYFDDIFESIEETRQELRQAKIRNGRYNGGKL